MPLKAVLSAKSEVDALPEAVRGLYVEKDGKFTLDVDGGLVTGQEALELKTKVREFRDTNIALMAEAEKLRPLATKFEGVDPDEYKTLKAEAALLKQKGVTSVNDIQGAIDKAVKAALEPVSAALTLEKTEREKATKLANDAKFRELVTADANKAGVAATAIRHVLREAEQVFELKEGALAPKAGVKHPTEPLKELTPNDWLQQLAKTDEYLFAQNLGSGAPGAPAPGGPRPGAKRLINPSPEEMGKHVDAIAKGEVIVVRQ